MTLALRRRSSASGSASTCSRWCSPCRTPCRRRTWASRPRRPPSSARWAARWAPRSSCRSCSPRSATRSPRRSAPTPATPAFRAALQDPEVLADPVNRRVVEAQSRAAVGCRRAPSTTRRSCPSSTTGWPGRSCRASPSAIDLVFTSAPLVLILAFVVVLFLPGGEAAHDVGHPGPAPAGRGDGSVESDEAAATTAAATAVSAPSSQMVDGAAVDEAGHDPADVGARR